MRAIPTDRVYDLIELDAIKISFAAVFKADLTLRAKLVKFRMVQGKVVQIAAGQPHFGARNLENANDYYRLEHHQVKEKSLEAVFRDERNGRKLFIDRHILLV